MRFCPTCQRRMGEQKDTGRERPCLVCGKPVESSGTGRPRTVHPECRKARARQYQERTR